MPTALRIDGYLSFSFSNEGNEPVHIIFMLKVEMVIVSIG